MRRGGLVRAYDWTIAEIEALRLVYSRPGKPVALADLAKELGRNKANVCRKARSLGLTNQRRAKVEQRKPTRMFESDEDLRRHRSETSKARIALKGHPRGALGLKHSPESLKKMVASTRAAWADPRSKFNTPEARQRRSDLMIQKIASGAMAQGYSRTRGGKREDLGGVYFRSAWEANYARYLNFLVDKGEIKGWQFEPKTFVFEQIKRGTRAYTPDFRVIELDGRHIWHEVKGWMDDKSKTRLARFARYYPEERLIVVDGNWFKSANKTIGKLIPHWEGGTVHV